jgi:hypothetical protein
MLPRAAEGEAMNPGRKLELHTHCFVRGPRSGCAYRNGVWDDGKVTHSHEDGSTPHSHPDCGPAYYGHGTPKTTVKPKGEQLPFIPTTEEENSFELVVTDSALMSVPFGPGGKGKLVPIGDTPLEALGFPAAERMIGAFRMKCIVRDERRGSKR